MVAWALPAAITALTAWHRSGVVGAFFWRYMVAQGREKHQQIRRPGRGRLMDAPQVELTIAVTYQVPKACRPRQAIGEFGRDDLPVSQLSESVAVGWRAAEPQPYAGRDREVDHYLDGLPQMQHDRVNVLSVRLQVAGFCREVATDPVQVSVDVGGTFGQQLAVDSGMCISRTHGNPARAAS